MSSKPWTDRDREVARAMRDDGHMREDIAERLGRTKKAIANFFDKETPSCAFYVGDEAIGLCPEERRLIRSAIAGSERLASTIKLLGLRP